MSVRKIKDARDLSTNELIYFKGHAKATFMSNGKTVEDAINGIETGGGNGGITVETDPIFLNSPAATITEEKIAEWNSKSAQGDKGDKGDTGVGVQSVAQTTTSNADGGSNVVTVTLTDGTTSTFTVKNGSKGSQGEQGIQGVQGIQGPKGETGSQGAKGDKGDKGDTGAAGTNGTNGVSVSSVKQTTTSTADGGTNVVTVTLSNGTTSTFNVKNGSKGSSGTNGKDGADGATFTPSVDSAGNLSWTNNKGLTNPPTVNIKGPKGDKGDAGEGGGSSGGSGAYSEVNHGTSDTTFTLTPNTFHVWDEVSSLSITFGSETSGVANEFLFQFTSGATATTLSLPDDIKWANELTIKPNMIYQVSILKGMASVLEFSNAPALIENKATLTDSTITFQYPVASELAIKVGMGTVTISAGEKSCRIIYIEPDMAIQSISPISDSTYYYTF